MPLLRTLGAAAGSAVVLYMIYHDDDENMPGRWSPFIATMAATYYRRSLHSTESAPLLLNSLMHSWRTTPSFGRRSGTTKRAIRAILVCSIFAAMATVAVVNGIQDVTIDFEGDQISLKVGQ